MYVCSPGAGAWLADCCSGSCVSGALRAGMLWVLLDCGCELRALRRTDANARTKGVCQPRADCDPCSSVLVSVRLSWCMLVQTGSNAAASLVRLVRHTFVYVCSCHSFKDTSQGRTRAAPALGAVSRQVMSLLLSYAAVQYIHACSSRQAVGASSVLHHSLPCRCWHARRRELVICPYSMACGCTPAVGSAHGFSCMA